MVVLREGNLVFNLFLKNSSLKLMCDWTIKVSFPLDVLICLS